VTSTPGAGATFVVRLPSAGAPCQEVASVAANYTGEDLPGASLLVMDDEEMIRELAREMLQYLGYQVTACEDGAQAIARYRAALEAGTHFAAVIMDLTIPGGMGGREAAEQILALDPHARLIVSSGYSTDPVMADFETYGFCAAIKKPYSMQALREELSRVLRSGQIPPS